MKHIPLPQWNRYEVVVTGWRDTHEPLASFDRFFWKRDAAKAVRKYRAEIDATHPLDEARSFYPQVWRTERWHNFARVLIPTLFTLLMLVLGCVQFTDILEYFWGTAGTFISIPFNFFFGWQVGILMGNGFAPSLGRKVYVSWP